MRKRKQYKKQRLMEKESTSSNPNPSTNCNRYDQRFLKTVNESLDTYCFICDRLFYPKGVSIIEVTEKVAQLFLNFHHDYEDSVAEQLIPEVSDKIIVCWSCKSNISGKYPKVPAIAKINNMIAPETPTIIEELTDIELRLLSRVKIFMKIFKLGKGHGQYALIGSAIHFAQCVEEIPEQLPLDVTTSGIIFVTEHVEKVSKCRELQVSLSRLKAGFQWLLENNHLYTSVTLSEHQVLGIQNMVTTVYSLPNEELDFVENLATQEMIEFNSSCNNSESRVTQQHYTIINAYTSYLLAGIHQGDACFGNTAGAQCTAMAAAFIAASYIKSPILWSSTDFVHVMHVGNCFYANKLDAGFPLFLNADEVDGCFLEIFSTGNIYLKVDELNTYNGMLQSPSEQNDTSFSNCLQLFLKSQHTSGIITCCNYIFGISKHGQFFFLFDSHSRFVLSEQGFNQSGSAIIYKLNIGCPESINYVHNLVYKNCGSPSMALFVITIHRPSPVSSSVPSGNIIPNSLHEFQSYQVNEERQNCVLSTNQMEVDSDEEVDSSNLESPNQISNSISSSILNLDINSSRAGNLNQVEVPSFIHFMDYNPPNIDSASKEDTILNITRKTAPPLKQSEHPYLEELGFVRNFSKGTFGFAHERPVSITPHQCFRTRILSRDKRFESTEYLFYALCRVEEHLIKSKISVCSNVVRQDYEDRQLNASVNLHFYMRCIRGTSSYWRVYTADILSMIRSLGTPAFFLTISYDDTNAEDLISMLHQVQHGTKTDVSKLSYEDRRNLLNRYPMHAARHYNHRIQAFIQLFKDDETLFGGRVSHHTVRIEFQARGSPHAHMLLWIENAPDWRTPEGLEFIERNISCSLETENKDLVLKYQRHKHSNTCYKGGTKAKKNYCRFNFPRQPSDSTYLKEEDDTGRPLVLKRSEDEIFINNYHPRILKLCRSNMDIQVITDENGLAFYVAKYVAKAEPENFTEAVRDALASLKSSDKENIRKTMMKLASTLLNKRVVSAQETAYRVCPLPLRHSSNCFVFVPACFPQNRTRMASAESTLQNPNFLSNIIDKYMNRPDTHHQICLFEFATEYTPVVRSKTCIEDADFDCEEEEEGPQPNLGKEILRLKENLGVWKKRTQQAIIRSPYFSIQDNPEEFLYSLLVLYVPFQIENFLIDGLSMEEIFENHKHLMRTQNDNPHLHPDIHQRFEQALLQLAVREIPPSIPITQAQVFDDCFEDVEIDVSNESNVVVDEAPRLRICNASDFRDAIGNLNSDQLRVYKKLANHMNTGDSEQLFLGVIGSGGTGKSYLIHVMSTAISNKYGCIAIIIGAPTGVSARNVSGNTLHRLFALGVELKGVPKYIKLGGEKL